MFLDLLILVLLLIVAIVLVHSKNLLHAIVFSSIFSLLCALLYLLMAAPDVALTEAAIGACVTTCFFLAALKHLGTETCKVKLNIPVLIACIALVVLIAFFSTELHSYGDADAITNFGVVEHYKYNFGEDTGLLSMVNAILSSYRGFDTFGETVVIFIAGMCVLLILDNGIFMKRKNEK